ncbi:allophanate hydrolase [Streptomyces sp. Li-HN-5-11]|uniref:allophanate hydrolase n=1 Tax=Streptomyces sp. Li-HN-5-11 TaxID=3075432 RepID=UPI0028AE63F2|nr:allophanate hydrolase [Streptomyces sp. Li-HN-5-11]WNM32863.1 allophanate hydrolase [Streptomyces sp. Li-HN-5-11]
MTAQQQTTAVARVRAAYARIAETDRPEIWITLRPQDQAEAEARQVDARAAAGQPLPLAGTVFAVKGNIDVAGLPTTAGCPSYAYEPKADAPAVARLRAAGAVVLGSTNLDQFATGLVGTRSPYGAVRSVYDRDRVSGGSSSGSAVAVALGVADFALGTDTAGSGRIPAAFNGIVGIKPTRGLIPTTGVVPACASVDCVTVFAPTVPQAERVFGIMAAGSRHPDPADGRVQAGARARRPGPWRVAVPTTGQLGEMDPGWAEAFEAAVDRLTRAGADLRTIDLTPFSQAAELLYEGAFVAERYTAVGAFIEEHAGSADLDPTVARIITAARDIPAHRLFADQDRLAALRAHAMAQLADADALLLPTAPGHPALAEVAADPIGANTRLGRFTNSTNLLGMCAIAVPAGHVGGLPFGVMLIAPAFTDDRAASIARLLTPTVQLAVAGAHLSGQPLNYQLRALGARLTATTATAPAYRLYALDTAPRKPGLVRVPEDGAPIEVEVWELPVEGLGALVASLPAPMAIGGIDLADGSRLPGFLCEPVAVNAAVDITSYRGWRAYLQDGRGGAQPMTD